MRILLVSLPLERKLLLLLPFIAIFIITRNRTNERMVISNETLFNYIFQLKKQKGRKKNKNFATVLSDPSDHNRILQQEEEEEEERQLFIREEERKKLIKC